MVFDAATDRFDRGGGAFECAQLLEMDGPATESCSFSNDATIAVVLNPSSTVEGGSTVTLRGGLLKAKDAPDCWPAAQSSNAVVEWPSNPAAPSVAISGPETAGTCGAVVLDGSTTSGSGGRPWKSVIWEAAAVGASATQAEVVAAAVAAARGEDSFVVEAEALGGVRIDVAVTFENYLGGSGSGAYAVTIADGAIPSVEIVGGRERTAGRSEGLRVSAMAEAATACGDLDTAKLDFSWSLVASDPTDATIAEDASMDQRVFEALPYSLDAPASYVLRVVVTDAAGQSNAAEAVITVVPAQIVALISGGSARVASTNAALVVDASESYDPETLPGDESALDFAWTCTGSGCPSLGSLASEPTLTVAGPLEPGAYAFDVVVSARDDRTAEARQVVEVVEGSVPSLEILPVEAAKVNPSVQVAIEATVGPNDASCVATWSLVEGALATGGGSLDGVTRSAVSKVVAAAASVSVPLVLAPAALTARSSYLFALEADCGAAGVARGSISIRTNGVPTSGDVAARPASGRSLTTLFTVSAKLWADDDLPLSYSFFSRVQGETEETQIVGGTLSDEYSGAVLPAGREAEDFVVSIVAYVADSFGASARATTSVTVELPASEGAEELAVLAGGLLSSALEVGDSEGVAMVVVASAAALGTSHDACGVDADGCPAPCDAVEGTAATCSGRGTCSDGACECDEGWDGAACETSAADYDAELSLRSDLIFALGASEATTLAAINQRTTALDSVVTQDAKSLSRETTDEALALSVDVALSSSVLGASRETTDALASVLGDLTEALAAESRDAAAGDTFAAAVDGLGAALLVDAVADQYAETTVSRTFAVTSQRLSNASGAAYNAAPVSPGARTSSASIGAAAGTGAPEDVVFVEYQENTRPKAQGDDGAIESTVLRFGAEPAGGAQDDALARRRLARSGTARGRRVERRRRILKNSQGDGDVVGAWNAGKRLATNYEFVIQRTAPKANATTDAAAANISVACDEEEDDADAASCPGFSASEMRDLVCVDAEPGAAFEVECGVEVVSTCLRYAEDVGDWDVDSCVVVEETATNTTCSCRAAPTSDYASSSSENAYLTYYARAFSPKRLSLKHAWPIIWLLVGLSATWLCLALVGSLLDRRMRAKQDSTAAEAAAAQLQSTISKASNKDLFRALSSSLPEGLTESRSVRVVMARTVSSRTVSATDRDREDLDSTVKTSTKLKALAGILVREHEWFASFLCYDEDEPRWARCLLAFLDIVLIIFGNAIVCWYQFPAGLCERETERESCLRVKSTSSFGGGRMCEYLEEYDEPCTFKDLNPTQEFYSELQVLFIGVGLTLPLIKLNEVIGRKYLFAPTRPGLPRLPWRRDGGDDATGPDAYRAQRIGAARLLVNLGIGTEGLDAAPRPAEFAANAALEATMRRVLERRMELVDAREAWADDRVVAKDLGTLLRCHERAWCCEPKPKRCVASRWRRRFAARTRARLVESLHFFEVFHDGLEAEAAKERLAARCKLQYASVLPLGTERYAFAQGYSASDDEMPATLFAKGAAIAFLLGVNAGIFYFLAVFANVMGRVQVRVFTDAAVLAIFAVAFLLIPLRILFQFYFIPRTIKDHVSHVGNPFDVPSVDFRTPLPVEPGDLAEPSAERPDDAPPAPAPPTDPHERPRAAIARGARVAAGLADAVASGDAKERRAANTFWRASHRSWAPEALARTADFQDWKPSASTRSYIVIVGIFLALHIDLQQTVVDECANIIFAVFMVGGELGLGVLHGGGHSSGGRRGGQPVILFWLVVVMLLCVAFTQRKVIAHIPQACWKVYRKGVKARRRRRSDPEHDSDASDGEKRLPPAHMVSFREGEVFPIDLDQEDKEERTRRQPRESSEDEAESSSEEELSDDELAAHRITTPLDELIPTGGD